MLDLSQVCFKQIDLCLKITDYYFLVWILQIAPSLISGQNLQAREWLLSQDEVLEGYLTRSMSIWGKKKKNELAMLSNGTRPFYAINN